jgi:hypothetical protein
MGQHTLQLVPEAGKALTPEQRRFNQLVAKIDKLRASLAQWQAQRPVAAEALARRLRPLQEQLHAQQCRLAHALEAQCAAKGWTAAQRRVLAQELCELLDLLIDDELTTEADAATFKALYDRRGEISHDEERQQSMQMMRAMFEGATGVDLGEAEFADEEELLAHAQRRLHEQVRAESEARDAAQAARPPRKQTAAQRRRAQEAEAAAQSQREIYRKLASALHPDRASDDADRAQRTALMVRVNQANDAGDLLALFALQLEIEQVDAAHIARATAERARHYNQLLAAQVKALEAEVEAQQMAVRADFLLDPFEPVRPQQLAALVEQQVAQLRAVLSQVDRMIQQLGEPASAKRLVKDLQRERKRFDQDFDIPF